MNKFIIKSWIIILLIIAFQGCSDTEVKVDREGRGAGREKDTEFEEPEEIEVPDFEYQGASYRSPFSRESGQPPGGEDGSRELQSINPEMLTVSGMIEEAGTKYGLLSGSDGFLMVKNGRIYNDDNEEIPGVSAVIKEDNIVIITDADTTYELPIPE